MSEAFQECLRMHPALSLFKASGAAWDAIQDLGLENLVFAWELSRMPQGLSETERRATAVLALCLLACQSQGHTRMDLETPPAPALAVLRACGEDMELLKLVQRLRETGLVGSLVGAMDEATAQRPILQHGRWLQTQRMRAMETSLRDRLGNLLQEPTRVLDSTVNDADADLPSAILENPVSLNPEQRAAVQLALNQPLALITGGPGTGKTSIVIAILRALLHQGSIQLPDIALAAPTGKAAQRMGESLRKGLGDLRNSGAAEGTSQQILEAFPEPMTLHRLLAWHPASERFRHDENNPLAARVVIVDEASMISLEHMDHLMRALRADARLILLGDADQLPSVEAGRVFCDLVEGLPSRCQRLRISYRMRESDPEGRNILAVARAIQQARTEELWSGDEPIARREQADQVMFRKVELLDADPAQIESFLHRWFEQQVLGLPGFLEKVGRIFHLQQGQWAPGEPEKLAELFEHFERFRILGALREAPEGRGVRDVNQLLHGWMAQRTAEGLRHTTAFHAGEPILMTSNDYRRGIFNGDQGIVLKVKFNDEVRQAAVFPRVDGAQAFLLEPLKPQLELCYAMTIHKSQGSEFDRIAILLPHTHHRALSRELLYTALTRARKAVVVLGEAERLTQAMDNPSARETGLGELLKS